MFVLAFAFIPVSKLDSRRNEEEDYTESFFHNVPAMK